MKLAAAIFAAIAMLAGSGHHARLTASGNDPLKVRGSGFHSRERVRLTITPTTAKRVVRYVRATRRGTFATSFSHMETCAGVTGVAAGNRGSHAAFNLSSVLC